MSLSKYVQGQKYTVYDNRTDLPVAVCASPSECAKAMGIKVDTFYVYLAPAAGARGKRWTIVREGLCMDFEDDARPKTIGEWMMIWRRTRGLTQRELSNLSGIPVNTIGNYEIGETFPGILNVIAIADVLDVSIDELIGRKRT